MTIIMFYVKNIKKSIPDRVVVALFSRRAGNNGAGCPL